MNFPVRLKPGAYLGVLLVVLLLVGCSSIPPGVISDEGESVLPVVERWYSDDPNNISVGIANIHNQVSMTGTDSIAENKQRILDSIDVLKTYDVNMIVFPEFALTGYFWEDTSECWDYMREGVTDNHTEWLRTVKGKLDETLHYIVFNNIRLSHSGGDRFYNSVFVVDKDFDCSDLTNPANEQDHIYDKTFLPGIEKTFTQSGQEDSLTLKTEWGTFGFTTCYDMCFTQIFQEYAVFETVDAIIQVASWRATGKRSYPGMAVETDRYYGFIWDVMASSQAAFNQVWILACNAVGYQERGDYLFWGGSGLWSPSGIELLQASHEEEELLVIHHIDILGETQYEQDDFHYYKDFIEVYDLIPEKRSFTRTKE